MIQTFKCYKYKEDTVYVNGIGKSEKTGKRVIIWRSIYKSEAEWLLTPEEEFAAEAKLIEKK